MRSHPAILRRLIRKPCRRTRLAIARYSSAFPRHAGDNRRTSLELRFFSALRPAIMSPAPLSRLMADGWADSSTRVRQDQKENIMPQSPHDRAAEFHNKAAHLHQAAATAHGKGDHLTAHELSKQAHEHSAMAFEHSKEAAANFKSG